MPSFTTNFSTPPALSTLTLTPNTSDSSIDLAWSISGLSAPLFYAYTVYRKNPESGVFDLIGTVTTQATLTFTDREAPHGIPAIYQVRVSNGWAESEPVQASTILDLNYWITHPTDPSLVFPVAHVNGFRERFPVQEERFEPLDRPEPVVVTGQAFPPEGTVSFRRFPSQDDPVWNLRRAQKATPYVVLKSPFGDVRRVRIGEVESERGEAGVRTGSFDYTTVG
jgi:hypothetical protein